jgi:ribonuclease HII
MAMKRAFRVMRKKLTDKEAARMKVIIDGLYVPDIDAKAEAIVKADDKIPSVMAASILAKIVRDNEMIRLSKIYPEYNYEKHKGYPTKEHKELLKELGPPPIQRMTFKY